jgi:hypothetical protein
MHEQQLRFPKLKCFLHKGAPRFPLLQFWTQGLAMGPYGQKKGETYDYNQKKEGHSDPF